MSIETAKPTDGTDFQNNRCAGDRDDRDILQLANSRVALEYVAAGVFAKIDHKAGESDYAGPLPQATIRALRDVAASCGGSL